MPDPLCPSLSPLRDSNSNSIDLSGLQYPCHMIPSPFCKYSFFNYFILFFILFFFRIIGLCVKSLNSGCLFGSWSFTFDLQFWWLFQIFHMALLLSYLPLHWDKMLFQPLMAVSLVVEWKFLQKTIITCCYCNTKARKLLVLQSSAVSPPQLHNHITILLV